MTQLGVNITGMIISGTATLYVQRFLWSRYGRQAPTQLMRHLQRGPGPEG